MLFDKSRVTTGFSDPPALPKRHITRYLKCRAGGLWEFPLNLRSSTGDKCSESGRSSRFRILAVSRQSLMGSLDRAAQIFISCPSHMYSTWLRKASPPVIVLAEAQVDVGITTGEHLIGILVVTR